MTQAGTALGQSLARCLARRSFDLLLCDEDGECLLGLREELAPLPVQVQLFQGDVGRPEHRRELLHFLRLAAVKPDLLAFQATRRLHERRLAAPPADVRNLLEANLLALDDLLRGGLLQAMLEEGNGYVLASLRADSEAADRERAVEAALGAGLRAYLAALGREMAGSGLGVTLHPLAPAEERLLARIEPGQEGDAGRGCAERALKALFARRNETGSRWQGWLLPRRPRAADGQN